MTAGDAQRARAGEPGVGPLVLLGRPRRDAGGAGGQPIEHPDEMDLPLPDAVARIDADVQVRAGVRHAYGGPVTEESLRKAIASFVRVLVSGDSPYDRHLRGDDAASARPERRGEETSCGEKAAASTATGGHAHQRRVLQQRQRHRRRRHGAADGDESNGRSREVQGARLRNVEVSAPYMHDGSLATLETSSITTTAAATATPPPIPRSSRWRCRPPTRRTCSCSCAR